MSLSFLHSMREKEYLLSAIRNGLMFTKHNVTFKLSDEKDVLLEDFKNKILLVEKQLGAYNGVFEQCFQKYLNTFDKNIF